MTMDPQRADGGPILPGTPLARALGGGAAPRLSVDFADRVVAAAEARAPALPPLRRPARWRTGRRLAVGLASFVALASAAAATGLLHQIVPSMPTAQTMWASISAPARAVPAPKPAPAPPPAIVPTPAPVEIVGPIDTPAELGEAFRRLDEVRAARREERRALADQRLASAIERRRAAGLPVPTAEEEARLRERIAAARAQREQRADAAIAERREALKRKVESGEALTREDIVRPLRPALPEGSASFEELRRMSPSERRAALRAMPPAERAAIVEEFRRLRAERLAPAPSASTAPTPAD